jgi:hypothetical protein
MAWIESHQSLLNHRKTGRLARKLGISKITAIGHLHAFWWWCMDNAPDGNLDSIDAEDIADGSGWEEDPTAFIDALIYAGFVDGEAAEPPYRIHDWHEYVGKLIEKREKDAERKRLARLAEGEAPSHQPPKPVRRTSSGRAQDGAGTVPNRTVPNRTVPNQEVTPPTPSAEAPPTMAAARPVRAVPKPRTLNQAQQARFDRWYPDYPNRQHKPEAEKAFAKLNPDDELTATLIADTAARQHGRKWAEGFIELPASYLNKRVWEDSIEPIRAGPIPIRGGRGNQRETVEEFNARTEREVLGDEQEGVPGAIDAAWRTHEQEAEPGGAGLLVAPVRRSAR